jgi:hypothetical protein
MPISFHCSCGERLEVDDELAGRQARCPYCEAVVRVPAAGSPRPAKRAKPVAPADTDDDRGGFSGSLNPLERSNRPSSRRRREDEDEDDRPSRRRYEDDEDPRPSRRRAAYDDDDEDDRPRRRRRFEPPPYKLFNNQTIGGSIAVVVSLTVFVGLLFFDVIWFWMLIIAVIGGISVIRGLITGRNG